MKKTPQVIFALSIALIAAIGCKTQKQTAVGNETALARATQTLDSLYAHYSVEGTCLLRENYPTDINYTATYLGSSEQKNTPNLYSYLWPYSGTVSAVSALAEATHNKAYQTMLRERVLPGVEEYFDNSRQPAAYSSYIRTAPRSDRFYDDNIWLGIDFTDLYLAFKEKAYLQKAELIWKFIESGTDQQLGGGIYWCEQKKESKNTCSNAPGSVLALKLFKATQDSIYLQKGRALYHWTQEHLQDSTDCLYFDNVSLDGNIGKAKFAYNSGQMMQAATLLYQLTGQASYLAEAQAIARGCYAYFFTDHKTEQGETIKLLKKGDVWFTAVMLRGFIELYHADHDKTYLNAFNESLNYAWLHARDTHGLFNTDFSGKTHEERKWLLTQAAMVEMYARLSAIK